MEYHERKLTREERYLAGMIRDLVPERERLPLVQKICTQAEELREMANTAAIEAGVSEEQRTAIWQAMHFPRYRFFDAAMPWGFWLQFADSPKAAAL